MSNKKYAGMHIEFVSPGREYNYLIIFVIFFIIFSVTVTEDGKKALLTLANGDMRKVLNVLQSTWLAFKNVTEDNVYTCVGHPLKTDIQNIVKWLLNDDFQSTYKSILY